MTAALLASGGGDAASSEVPAGPVTRAPSADLVIRDVGGLDKRLSLLARGGFALDRPSWSPDGKRIYVVRQTCAACPRTLAWVPSRGGATRSVELRGLGRREPVGSVAFSRAGRSVAVAVVDAEGERAVALLRRWRASELRELDDATEPAWSPGGQRLAYTAEFDEIRRIVLEGAKRKPQIWAHGDYSEDQPTWSPDGTRLAFSRLEPSMTWDICVARLGRAGVSCVTQNRANDRDPVWSPDGRRIAFASDRAGGRAGTRAIYVADADGAHVRRVTAPSSDSWGPAWSPDGTRLVFVRRPFARAS